MASIDRIVTRSKGMVISVIVLASVACLLTLANPAAAERGSPGIVSGSVPLLAERGPTGKRQEVQKKLEEERRVKAAKERKKREAAKRDVEKNRAAAKRAVDVKRKAEQERRRRAAMRRIRVFKDCALCPTMVVIPGGTFRMGSNSGAVDEKPVHRVTVRRFAMGKYEVTFAQWDVCAVASGCSRRPADHGWGRGSRPVINVSWNDAKQYVAWLSLNTGKRYRLPSEAEWEYAARAGTRTKYWWGNAIGRNKANCKGCGSRWDESRTAPVGSFPANRFGLYDVSGNVWEWVEDCWHKTYVGAPTNGRPWTTGGICWNRMVRGGSWYYRPRNLRPASRIVFNDDHRYRDQGFRVARTLP